MCDKKCSRNLIAQKAHANNFHFSLTSLRNWPSLFMVLTTFYGSMCILFVIIQLQIRPSTYVMIFCSERFSIVSCKQKAWTRKLSHETTNCYQISCFVSMIDFSNISQTPSRLKESIYIQTKLLIAGNFETIFVSKMILILIFAKKKFGTSRKRVIKHLTYLISYVIHLHQFIVIDSAALDIRE